MPISLLPTFFDGGVYVISVTNRDALIFSGGVWRPASNIYSCKSSRLFISISYKQYNKFSSYIQELIDKTTQEKNKNVYFK